MRNLLTTILVSLVIAIGVHVFWPKPAVVTSSSVTIDAKQEESLLERIQRTGAVRCGYTPWPPFWEVDANTNQSKGLTKELSDKFFQLAGWKPEYIAVAAGSEVSDLKTGKIDLMCGAGPWYIGTLKEINYTHPYYFAGVYVYGRDDETRFAAQADLNSGDAHFVGLDGDLSIDLVQRLFPQANIQTLTGLTDPAQMMLNVTTRKADLVIIDPITAESFNKNNDVKLKSLFPDQPIAVYGGGFSMRKGETELLETMNGMMDMMNAMNIPEQLIKRYGLDTMGLRPAAKVYR
jgi:polar amino acid transport system substrate-binding protein